MIALKLKEVFELNDINELPIVYNISWYEQKAVLVLLALLYLMSNRGGKVTRPDYPLIQFNHTAVRLFQRYASLPMCR